MGECVEEGGGVSDDLIQQSPKLIAQIVIALFEGGVMNLNHPNDEILARGLMDMAHDAMVDHFRAMKAPKVLPANGMPADVAKYLKGK